MILPNQCPYVYGRDLLVANWEESIMILPNQCPYVYGRDLVVANWKESSVILPNQYMVYGSQIGKNQL